jgi:predicted glycosyltransferase
VDSCESIRQSVERRFSAQRILGATRDSSGTIKVCIYSHDTFGLGHLRRNLAIAEQLLRSEQRFEVWLLTGSPVIRQWSLPAGLHVQPLPPVVKTGADRYVSRIPGEMFGLTQGYREALIIRLLQEQRPDVFLVDHAPAGMNGELLSALALIRNEMPETRTVLGLRDILDSPAAVRKAWREQQIEELIAHAYDDVLVYGSQGLFDVVQAYGLGPTVARRTRYCGYIVGPGRWEALAASSSAPLCWDTRRAGDSQVVLVTAGGGGDGYFLMDAYLRSLEHRGPRHFHSVIVTGPLMPQQLRARIEAAADRCADVQLVTYTTDLMPSVRAASLVVSMAGYNTSVELLAARKRAIVVPRSVPREEQLLRASMLSKLGLVRCLEPQGDLAGRLAEIVPQALGAAPPDDALWAAVDLRGAERVVEQLAQRRSRLERPLAAAPGVA